MANTEVYQTVGTQKKPILAIPYLKPATKMTVLEFTKWLERLDGNGDGVISRVELEKAVKALGLWFSNYKTKQAMAAADFNDNGIIDTDEEFKQLMEYAQKHWGLTICED